MINLIFNGPLFHEAWAEISLEGILKKDMKVLVLSARSGNFAYYDVLPDFKSEENIIEAFTHYGIRETDIMWFDACSDNRTSFEVKLEKADILYLTGDDPMSMMDLISDLRIHRALLTYDGIVIGDDAGSYAMMETFDSYDEEYDGIGYLRGFSLEMAYVEDVRHLSHIIREIEVKGKAVFGCPYRGGIVIADGRYELLGDAFTCSEYDLDHIYDAYEDAKSRQEYYGDNNDQGY